MTTPWAPFPGGYRPTASTINDETLDEILERLELAEGIAEIITLRLPWGQGTEEHSDRLFQILRRYLHRKHLNRLTWISGVHRRDAERCTMCTHWATTLSWRWSDRATFLSEADEARLKSVSELIERTHPTMAHTDLETGQQARRELPWLMSVIRRLQRDVRREQGAFNGSENRLARALDAERGLEAEVKRLRKKLSEI